VIKTLIIEDEERAARQLTKMLAQGIKDHQIMEIIDSIEDSVAWIKSNAAPDLIFMDIQLADGLSFEIFQQIEITCPIIFTTAFDQYAIKAFKVNSIDYLLKPIKQDDLDLAIAKYDRLTAPMPPSAMAVDSLMQLLQSQTATTTRNGVLVRDGTGFVQIVMSDIAYLYSSDSITFAIASGKRYIIDETIDQFLSTVDPDLFFRINRGQVVAKSAVQRIEHYLNHRLKLTVEHSRDMEFVVSRAKANSFKEWMNK
jgi:DNA-binding LytR/AlgR family response regulator